MPIRCKSLQTFQQCRDNHEDSPDQERPGPSETEKERDSEIANDVVELPTEVRAGRLFFRPEGSDHKQDHDGHATSFCARAQRGVIGLVAMRTQNGPIRLFKQQFTFTWHRPQRENLGFLVERLALR
jgi:hypothetical protein